MSNDSDQGSFQDHESEDHTSDEQQFDGDADVHIPTDGADVLIPTVPSDHQQDAGDGPTDNEADDMPYNSDDQPGGDQPGAEDIAGTIKQPEEQEGESISQVSSTRAIEDGDQVTRQEHHFSRASKEDVFPPTAPSDSRGMDNLMLSLTSGTVPGPTAPTVVHSRLPSKSQASLSRQQSRASLNNSQNAMRLPGITSGTRGYTGGLRRAEGAMGSIDLNRSVMESLVSSDLEDRKKSAQRLRDGRWPSPKRPRVPSKFVKVSRVSLTTRLKTNSAPPHVSYQDVANPPTSSTSKSKSAKVITWDEANNHRPPLRIDMEGPTPWSYSPRNKPLYETNAPMHSFGRRTFVEKDGGSRTAWNKTWFQSGNIWTQKADFHSDQQWPSPNKIKPKTCLGPNQATGLGFPAYTCGIRRTNGINKKGSELEPSPGDYNPEKADKSQRVSAPSFSHGLRRGGTVIWMSTGNDTQPGPGTYNPSKRPVKPHNPNFTIRGNRREVEHEYGPFAAF